jgi:hypothetical protein
MLRHFQPAPAGTMRLFTRIVVIAFAFLVASLAAGAVVTLAVLLPEWSDLALGPFDRDTFGIVLAFGTIFVSGFALLPLILVVVVAEAMAIRSVLFYAIAGALAGFVVYYHLGIWDISVLTVAGETRREIEIMSGAGIVAGFVYWAIAGRSAGAWRQPPLPGP